MPEFGRLTPGKEIHLTVGQAPPAPIRSSNDPHPTDGGTPFIKRLWLSDLISFDRSYVEHCWWRAALRFCSRSLSDVSVSEWESERLKGDADGRVPSFGVSPPICFTRANTQTEVFQYVSKQTM